MAPENQTEQTKRLTDQTERLMQNEEFKGYVSQIARDEISNQFKLENPPTIAKIFISLLGFVGLETSPRFVLAIVPITLSILISLGIVGTNWYFKAIDVSGHATKIGRNTDDIAAVQNSVQSLDSMEKHNKNTGLYNSKEISKTNKKIAEIVGQLNSYPDGYFFETIDLSRKWGSTIYLPAHKDYVASLKIFSRDLNSQQIETMKDERLLIFKINDKIVYEDELVPAGWSSAHRFFEFTTIPRLSRKSNELVFDEEIAQKFQFRLNIKNSEDPVQKAKWELYSESRYSVLLVIKKQFFSTQANALGPDASGD